MLKMCELGDGELATEAAECGVPALPSRRSDSSGMDL